MKLTKALLMLLALVAGLTLVTACSDDEESADIVLEDKGATDQTVFADTKSPKGIKFKALKPWTATVTEGITRGGDSEVDWLTLSQYSGETGEYTITIYLKENLTGKDRSATITIDCGETKIVITIVQKGTNQDGTMPVLPKDNLLKKFVFEFPAVMGFDLEDVVMELEYDDMNRLSKLKASDPEGRQPDVWEISYPQDKSITIVSDGTSYEAVLNDKGYVTSLAKENAVFDLLRCEYNSDGYLAYEKYNSDWGSYITEWTYDGDLLSKIISYNESAGIVNEDGYDFPASAAYALKIPNTMNVDIFSAMSSAVGSDFDLPLMLAGVMGKRLPYLLEIQYIDAGETKDEEPIFTTPNVTKHIRSGYTHQTSPYGTCKYIRQGDIVTKAVITLPMVTEVTEYDAVVGNTLINPDYPGEGYAYTRTNEQKTTKNMQLEFEITCEYY